MINRHSDENFGNSDGASATFCQEYPEHYFEHMTDILERVESVINEMHMLALHDSMLLTRYQEIESKSEAVRGECIARYVVPEQRKSMVSERRDIRWYLQQV